MNQSSVLNWHPDIPLLCVEVSLILALFAHRLSAFPGKATFSSDSEYTL